MSKFADELADIARRTTAMRDTVTASNDSTAGALERIDSEMQALRSTNLDDEQRKHVDSIDEQLAEIRTASESTGDKFTVPTQEPAPVKATKGRPAPGSAADRERTSV